MQYSTEIQQMLKAQAVEYNNGGYTESETESDFETLDNSSANLSESTNQTTAREIAAANRTLAIAKDQGADPGAIMEAEAKLDEARVAYQAGLEDLAATPDCCNASASLSTQSTDLEEAITARQQATGDFIDAYHLALNAIIILENAGVERLEIESPRAAPPAGTTANITIAGNIYVTTKEEVDQVRVTDPESTAVVDVQQPDNPPGNATFLKRAQVDGGPMIIQAIAESETDDEPGPNDTVPVDFERVIFDGDGSTATDIFSSQGAVHQTYALYGVDIQFVIDDEINNSELSTIDNRTEARFVEDTYHNQSDSTAYFFITSDWAPGDVEGKASSIGDNFIEGHYGAFLFTAQNQQGTTHNAKTSVHEIGHLLGTGRFDDTPYNLVADIPPVDDADEVYSGAVKSDRGIPDNTPENVALVSGETRYWSVMTGGWHPPLDDGPMYGEYITFSIEEVLHLEFNNVDSEGD